MKHLFLKTVTLFFTILLINCSNNDPEDHLPPITQTGANTFGCLIDGELLIPRNGTGTIYGADRGMVLWASGNTQNYDYQEITVHDYKSDTRGRMDIHLINLHQNGEGSFSIKESNCYNQNNANSTINIRCRYNGIWYCSIENSGVLMITRYDYENHIISGTFSFTAQNSEDPTDIIEITKGRFDINWYTLESVIFP